MLYLNMLYITLIVILIIDDSGFITSIKKILGKYLKVNYNNIRLKPIDCSYCSTFWCNAIYLLLTSNLTIFNILVALLFASFTIQIYNFIILIKELITKIYDKIYEKIL